MRRKTFVAYGIALGFLAVGAGSGAAATNGAIPVLSGRAGFDQLAGGVAINGGHAIGVRAGSTASFSTGPGWRVRLNTLRIARRGRILVVRDPVVVGREGSWLINGTVEGSRVAVVRLRHPRSVGNGWDESRRVVQLSVRTPATLTSFAARCVGAPRGGVRAGASAGQLTLSTLHEGIGFSLANSPQVGLTLDAGEGAAAGRFSGNVGLPVHRVSQEASGVVHIAASGRIILTRGTSSVTLQSPTARLTGATGLLVFRALGGPTVRFDLEVKARTPIPRGTRLSVWARVQENAASFLGNRLGIPLQAGDLAAVLTVTIPR